jgi:hypothetical protein
MQRRGIVSLANILLAGSLALAVVVPGVSLAVSPVSASGRVSGSLHEDSRIVVRIQARDDRGWQAVSAIDVVFLLRGRSLDRVTVDPSHSSLTITGGDAPQALGFGGTVQGAFFRVDSRSVVLTARGPIVSVTIPLVMVAPPPPGARLYYDVSDSFFHSTGLHPMGVQTPKDGLTWGALIIAVLLALLAGGFIGTVFTSRQRRPPPFSVYEAVQRRMAEATVPGDRPS